jgi:hypothetical protein
MGRIEDALARFNAALDALEKHAENGSGNRGSLELAAELAELKRDRERLRARVLLLEEESQSLTGLTEAVETRLDGAIAEIRAALGRG